MPFVSRLARHPSLVGLVDQLWWAEPEHGAPADRIEWIAPTCRAQIILAPGESIFVGPKTRAALIQRRTDLRAVGVSFTAGASDAVIPGIGRELCDGTAPLDAVFTAGSLAERLAELDADAALDHVEAELARRIRPDARNSPVLAAEQALRNGLAAGEVPSLLGADRRTLVPQFRRVVGVGLKHYERICRFNRSLEAIRRADAPPLAWIAHENGFADQAHLTREFVHFAVSSPARLHRDGSGMVNHIDPDKIFKT